MGFQRIYLKKIATLLWLFLFINDFNRIIMYIVLYQNNDKMGL